VVPPAAATAAAVAAAANKNRNKSNNVTDLEPREKPNSEVPNSEVRQARKARGVSYTEIVQTYKNSLLATIVCILNICESYRILVMFK
jgi:hypothetical protein